MTKKLDKEYSCPHCFQTSNRRYNIQIHIQRKHLNPHISKVDGSISADKWDNLLDSKKSTQGCNGLMVQSSPHPLSPEFYHYSNPSDAYANSFFYIDLMKEKEDKERRESYRKFIRKMLEYGENVYTLEVSKFSSPFPKKKTL